MRTIAWFGMECVRALDKAGNDLADRAADLVWRRLPAGIFGAGFSALLPAGNGTCGCE